VNPPYPESWVNCISLLQGSGPLEWRPQTLGSSRSRVLVNCISLLRGPRGPRIQWIRGLGLVDPGSGTLGFTVSGSKHGPESLQKGCFHHVTEWLRPWDPWILGLGDLGSCGSRGWGPLDPWILGLGTLGSYGSRVLVLWIQVLDHGSSAWDLGSCGSRSWDLSDPWILVV
jgi:hypothetical protein